MLAIESSVARIESALKRVSKRALANAAKISHANLRGIGDPDWNPTRRTLKALEAAIESGIGDSSRHRELKAKVLPAAGRCA